MEVYMRNNSLLAITFQVKIILDRLFLIQVTCRGVMLIFEDFDSIFSRKTFFESEQSPPDFFSMLHTCLTKINQAESIPSCSPPCVPVLSYSDD
jgi:hypothetical protein